MLVALLSLLQRPLLTLRKTLQESRRREQNQEEAITVSAFGQTKTVQDRQVLIAKPKSGGKTDSAKLIQATDDVRSALKSILVDNIRKTNTVSLDVKFPSAEAKSEASDLMSSCFENNDDFVVSQPKKMLPKMTLTGIPSSFPEGEIIDGILSKNEIGSQSPCMRPRSDPPKMKNSTPDKIVAKKEIKK